MLKALFFILWTLNCIAISNQYKLNVDLSLDGHKIISQQISNRKGKTTTFSKKTPNGETFIEITADDDTSSSGILMKFVIGKKDLNGKTTIISTPRIITLENQQASVTEHNDRHQEILMLSVTAHRQ